MADSPAIDTSNVRRFPGLTPAQGDLPQSPTALLPASEDPFAGIDPHMSGPAAEPDHDDPFGDAPPLATGETGAPGAFVSHAARGVLPMVGGMAAAGAGAEAGAGIGAGIGGVIAGPPGAVVGGAIGGFAGGLGGFFAGSAATETAQDWTLKQLPMAAQESLDQSERAQREQETEHPYASFMGGIAPYAITMSPGGWTKGAANLPTDATAFQKIMANPITQKTFSGAMMGGMELGNEWTEGQPTDWAKVGISTGFGLVFSRENRAGEYLTSLGAQPVARLFAPHLEVPAAGVLNPLEPTVAQAGDVGVIGPGITEHTFRGGEQQSDASRATAQNAAADEQASLGALPTPDLDAIARRLEPDTFARNDELLAQRDALRSWIQNESAPPDEAFDALDSKRAEVEAALGYANPNSPDARNLRAQLKDVAAQRDALQARRDAWAAGEHVDTPDIMLARQHLLDTEHALWDLAPDISAARRRAADHVGEPELEPEPAVATVPPAQEAEAGVAPPQAAAASEPKSPEAQRAFITADRATQLMAAGLSRATAEASAAVEAHYYATLSARFNGALGTAEDLYRARAARVVGPGQAAPTEGPGSRALVNPQPITRTEPLRPPTIRSIADIQAQDGVGAKQAKRTQEAEILARGRVIEPGTPRAEPVVARPAAAAGPLAPEEAQGVRAALSAELAGQGGALPAAAERIPEEVAQAPTIPQERPRLRSGADIAREDGIKDPAKIIAIQNQEMIALAEWQAAHPSGEPRPKRNRAADRLAETAGIPTAGVPEPAVLTEIVDRLPEERVVEEVNAAAEAGEIEYVEAEAAVPETTENPDTFYDADQSRPLEELESEHRPANEAAAPEQRPGGGGEPEAAAEGPGPVPEGGGPVGAVGGAGERAAGEAAERGDVEHAVAAAGAEPAYHPEPGGVGIAAKPGTTGEQGVAAGAEPAGVASPPEQRLAAATAAHQAAVAAYDTLKAEGAPKRGKRAYERRLEALRSDLLAKSIVYREALQGAGYDPFTGKLVRDQELIMPYLRDWLAANFTPERMKWDGRIKEATAAFMAAANGEEMPTLHRQANAHAQAEYDRMIRSAYDSGKAVDTEISRAREREATGAPARQEYNRRLTNAGEKAANKIAVDALNGGIDQKTAIDRLAALAVDGAIPEAVARINLERLTDWTEGEWAAARARQEMLGPSAPEAVTPRAVSEAKMVETRKGAPEALRALYEISALQRERNFNYAELAVESGMASGEWEAEHSYQLVGRGKPNAARRAEFERVNKIADDIRAETDRQAREIMARHSVGPADLDAINRRLSRVPDGIAEGVETYLRDKYGPAARADLFQRLRQSIQGKIRISPGETRSVITLARSADASTFMHETAHDWLKQLLMDAAHALAPQALRDDAATVRTWLKRPEGWTGFKRDGTPDVAPQERFARAFEQYLREGHAPSRALDGVFAQFKSWLTTIYRTLRGLGAPISDDIRGVFDRMLAIEPRERVTHGEVPDRGPSIADIHEADAAETHSREAEAVADRIAAERARTVSQPPAEVANEVARQQPPAEPGTTEPGAEAPGGPTGRGEVPRAGGQSEPITERGGVGAGHGPVGAGRGEAPAEGPRLPGGTAEPGNAGGRRGAGDTARSPAEQLAPKPADQFPPGAESDAVDLAGNVRTRNIRDRDEFVQAAKDSAERNHNYDAVRGRGATMGAMIDLADALNLDHATITEQQLGRIFGGVQDLGPQIWALRDIIGEQGLVVHDLWAKAAASKAPEDIAASAVEMARFDMMMTTLSGVTAKQGRNLGMSFRNMENWQHAKDLNQFLKENTGKDLYQLQVIAKLGARMDTPRKVSKMLQDAQRRSWGRFIVEYWVNGLISGLATHATYVVGNELLSMMKAGPETATAAALGAFRARMGRAGTRVRFGEVGAQFGAQFREAPATLQAGIEALRSGATTQLPGEEARPLMPFQGDTSLTMSRGMTNKHVTWQEALGDLHGLFQGMRDGLVATGELVKAGGVEGAPTWGTVNSPLGAIPGIAYKGVEVLPLGHIARLPSRSVAAIHSSFRMMNYSMELNALAFRQAADEGLAGEAFAARVADLRQNPPEEMMEAARGRATDLTLMGQGGKLTQALGNFFNKTYDLPLLGETPIFKFVDPFVHIAGNIMNQSLMQRTPIGLLSREIRADLAGKNGNVAQDTTMAKMLVGTAIAVTFGGLAAQGLASGSGPADPNKAAMWRLAGNQPHSVRIGDMWYAVNRLGPMGLLLSVAADMYDVAHMMGTEDAGTVGSALMHAFTQNILDESFMRGPADLIRATTESDRYGSAYIRNLLPSFLPFSVLQAQMARATDPYSRQARTIMDAIRARVPGLSETLFPRRDIWGEPMPSGDALIAPGITAIYARRMSADPVNLAMLALGVSPAPVERQIRNVKLTDQQYDDFARLAGRATKIRLDAIVQSPLWATMPSSSRYEVVEETIKQNREASRGLMFMKYPQIPRDAAKAQIARKTGETVH